MYNSYSSENMSFTQVEGSVTLSGPNSLGNLRAMEEQTALYNSFRSASKSIVILDVAYECVNMFVFPTPFLVGRNRRNCSFFDLAFFCGRLQGTDLFNHLLVTPLVYNHLGFDSTQHHSSNRAISHFPGHFVPDLLQQKHIFGTQPVPNICGSRIHHHRWLLLKKNEIVALCFLCLPLPDRPPCLFCLSLVLGSS